SSCCARAGRTTTWCGWSVERRGRGRLPPGRGRRLRDPGGEGRTRERSAHVPGSAAARLVAPRRGFRGQPRGGAGGRGRWGAPVGAGTGGAAGRVPLEGPRCGREGGGARVPRGRCAQTARRAAGPGAAAELGRAA